VERIHLVQTAPGTYRGSARVPVGGNWKSLVLLVRGDTFEAVPIAMPADPAYRLAAIEPPASRIQSWAPAERYLVREFRAGVPWTAYILTSAFFAIVVAWTASLALAYRAVGRLVAGVAAGPAQAPSVRRRPKRRRALS
jgi:hypothetical protein